MTRIDELKVLVDSNVIISALLWPNSIPANALELVMNDQPILNAAIAADVDVN
jgi:predicted nucleic acid-binding protein